MHKTSLSVLRFTPLVLSFGLVFLVNGCQDLDRDTSIAAPAWHYTVDHFTGSIQSGPIQGQTVQIDPNTALRVTVTWIGLRHRPRDILSPIESRIERIIALPEPKLVRPVIQFSQNTRFGPIEDPNAFLTLLTDNNLQPATHLGSFAGLLPMGVCSQFAITSDNIPDKHSQLELSRPSLEQVQIALATTARTPVEPNQIRRPHQLTETVILEPVPVSDTAHFAILFPCAFPEAQIATLAALIELRSPGHYAEDQGLLDLCQANLTKAGPSQQRAAHSALPEGIQEAFRRLYDPVSWRRNLLFLATASDATLTQDIVLAGEWYVAHQLSTDIAVAIQVKEPNDLSELGWIMESYAYSLLLKIADEKITPTIEAWLILHAGQLGRDPAALGELIGLHNSAAGLHKALIKENRLYLLDMSPAARSRAYEWLKAQGETFNDYDPLASAKMRRKALETAKDYYD